MDVAEYRVIAGPDFIHYAIFTGHFFHSSPGIHTPPWRTNWRCNWFCDECPARKAAALAKASVNKVVFIQPTPQFVIGQAEAGGHQVISQVLATGISASSNSGQFSHYQGNGRYSQREIRWRYCAGIQFRQLYFCGFNRKIQFAQQAAARCAWKSISPLIPTTHISSRVAARRELLANLTRLHANAERGNALMGQFHAALQLRTVSAINACAWQARSSTRCGSRDCKDGLVPADAKIPVHCECLHRLTIRQMAQQIQRTG